MKKITIILENVYFFLFLFIIFIIVIINHLVRGSIYFSDKIFLKEEYVENLFIIILALIGYLIFSLYKKEIAKKEKLIKDESQKKQEIKKQLDEYLKYIGKANVQLQGIKKIMIGLDKFPENKLEFKNIHNYLLEKVLSVVNADWVISRIIDLNSENILQEKIFSRGKTIVMKYQTSTRQLINGDKFKDYTIITSRQTNLGLKTFFIFPKKHFSKDDIILVQGILQQIEMIYIIYNSEYYKKVNKK